MNVVRESRAVLRPLASLPNFREVGGLRTADGRMFRTGVLFRSSELSRLRADDLAKFEGLGIELICDLRSVTESKKRPTRLPGTIRVVNIPLHEHPTQDGSLAQLLGFVFGEGGADRFREVSMAFYRHIAFERPAPIREIITLLSEERNLPALLHCTAGKDRTGFLSALIQLLVGIPYETVLQEYLRTNDALGPRLEKLIALMRIVTLFQVSEERMRLLLMARPEFLDEVHDTISKQYGDVETYLREACGIHRDTLQKLKEALLTPSEGT